MAAMDISTHLANEVRSMASSGSRIAINGSGSKRFLTGKLNGTPLDVTRHHGIVNYEPTELVITARAGTPLNEIETILAEKNQMLAFEPPHFGPGATLGGTIACNLSGPRRPYTGSARDFVLGTRIINGKGEILSFGGQVMKNVAGYDVSRLMTGSRGTLGVILEVSLKVLPRPAQEMTLTFEMSAGEAIRRMNTWAGQPLPLSAAAHNGETLYIRVSGPEASVRATKTKLGGESLKNSSTFWEELREHRRSFFKTETPLWRLSVPPATALIDLPGKWLLDWGGAQRWLLTTAPVENIHRKAESAGGTAALFRTSQSTAMSNLELSAPARRLQANIKQSMDPAGILNTG